MNSLRLEYNEDGKVLGFRPDGVEVITSSDGSVTFYADTLYDVNPKTGEKTDITPRTIMRNGDDVVAVDDYVNSSYIFGGK